MPLVTYRNIQNATVCLCTLCTRVLTDLNSESDGHWYGQERAPYPDANDDSW
jgi:hypothetical protein